MLRTDQSVYVYSADTYSVTVGKSCLGITVSIFAGAYTICLHIQPHHPHSTRKQHSFLVRVDSKVVPLAILKVLELPLIALGQNLARLLPTVLFNRLLRVPSDGQKADECPEYAPKGSEACPLNVCCSKIGYIPAIFAWICRPITDIVDRFCGTTAERHPAHT